MTEGLLEKLGHECKLYGVIIKHMFKYPFYPFVLDLDTLKVAPMEEFSYETPKKYSFGHYLKACGVVIKQVVTHPCQTAFELNMDTLEIDSEKKV